MQLLTKLLPVLLAPVLLFVSQKETSAAEPQRLDYSVKLEVAIKHDEGDFLWFHPRAVSYPAQRDAKSNDPLVLMTIQKHLKVSDYYSGLHFMKRSAVDGQWTGPELRPELDWQKLDDGMTLSVADVTPGYHSATGKVIAIGCRVRYNATGKQLDDVKQAHQTVYAVYDPVADRWSKWQQLELPEREEFNFARCACAQWLVKPDGTLLVPLYIGKSAQDRYSTTVAHCRFDGQQLNYIAHGSILRSEVPRGLYEPSLIAFNDRYYLTLRNDVKGYVARSSDGLMFDEPRPWQFDDGSELGSYNTQQHWLAHSEALFLVYTRRGANNDHIIRHRAPLFMAQVDTEQLQVIRATERVIVPERGAELGNFGACAINATESWVTVSEGMFMKDSKTRGAEGATFVARIQWARPNLSAVQFPPQPDAVPVRIVTLGDSITKGVRTGVRPEDTFAKRIEKTLTDGGLAVEVINVGVGGERTDGALKRLTKEVLALKPAIVTIMYGTNDSYVDQGATESRLTADTYRRNLVQLVDALREAGSRPILMTEPRWGAGATSNGAGEHPNLRLEKFMVACRQVAKEKQVPLVDHFQIWSDAEASGKNLGNWTTDQCHPNPEGHQQLADAMLSVIKSLIHN